MMWILEPEGDGTEVTCEADYTAPVSPLGKLGEAFIARVNEHETETPLGTLKAGMGG